MHVGMPLAHLYHVATGSVILNSASSDAEGLEKMANVILIPSHYVTAARYFETTDGVHYASRLRYDYNTPHMWAKTGFAALLMPASLVIGGALKTVALLDSKVLKHQQKLFNSYIQGSIESHKAYYERCGITIVPFEEAEYIQPPTYQRRPGDEAVMNVEKEALKEIVKLLNENQIPYWLDCGTLLGAQRYGGIIPWDFDLDIAMLTDDFDNVFKILSKLDPAKYAVQDWSSRDRPKSYLKVYVKETGALIDLYNFQIDPEKQVIRSILSNENSIFLPESWKIRERRFILDTPISYVFPLKKAHFDGIEVFVPSETVKYLQQRYGENIGPAKLYNEVTGRYEKDLSHPYWKMPHAH